MCPVDITLNQGYSMYIQLNKGRKTNMLKSEKFDILFCKVCKYTTIFSAILSSPLGGKRDKAVTIGVRCMCVR